MEHPRRTAVWLFLFLTCLFVLTSSGRVRVIDEVLPVYQTESLVERGSTAVPQAVSQTSSSANGISPAIPRRRIRRGRQPWPSRGISSANTCS